jgi:hypothetical protein
MTVPPYSAFREAAGQAPERTAEDHAEACGCCEAIP